MSPIPVANRSCNLQAAAEITGKNCKNHMICDLTLKESTIYCSMFSPLVNRYRRRIFQSCFSSSRRKRRAIHFQNGCTPRLTLQPAFSSTARTAPGSTNAFNRERETPNPTASSLCCKFLVTLSNFPSYSGGDPAPRYHAGPRRDELPAALR